MIGVMAAAAVVSAEARTAIDAAHADLGRGFSARDLASWERLLHPDLKVWWAGKLLKDKAGWIALARQEVTAFQDPLEARISTVSLEPDGRDVVSVTHEQTCFHLADRTRTLRRVCYDQTYVERWRGVAAAWRVIEMRYSGQMAQTLDGRPVSDAQLRAAGL
jgi:hypothetical protein